MAGAGLAFVLTRNVVLLIIAAILGVSDTTPYYWAKKYSQPTPGRDQPRGNAVGCYCPNCSVAIDAEGLRGYLDNLARMYEGPGHAPGFE